MKYAIKTSKLTDKEKSEALNLVYDIVAHADSIKAAPTENVQSTLRTKINDKMAVLSEILKKDQKLAGTDLDVPDHDLGTDGLNDGSISNFGEYFKELSGTNPPESMKDKHPHAHHIVFKGKYTGNPEMRKHLAVSREILESVGINWYRGRENLVWAPNNAEQHTPESAGIVKKELVKAARNGSVKEKLVDLGLRFSKGGGL